MALEFVLAVASLCVSVFVAAAGGCWGFISATEQNRQKTQLEYELQARTKLYENCEPLLFLAGESCRHVYNKVKVLMRLTRVDPTTLLESGRLVMMEEVDEKREGDAHIGGDTPAVYKFAGYYLLSVVHDIAQVLGYYWLLKRAVSITDIRLDPSIQVQYLLLKHMMLVWTRDYDFGEKPPLNDLKKYVPSSSHLRPVVQRDWKQPPPKPDAVKQGCTRGQLEEIARNMVSIKDGESRVLEYDEFRNKFLDADDNFRHIIAPLMCLVHGFHPETHYVVRRMLFYMASSSIVFCGLVRNMNAEKEDEERHNDFNWSSDSIQQTVSSTLVNKNPKSEMAQRIAEDLNQDLMMVDDILSKNIRNHMDENSREVLATNSKIPLLARLRRALLIKKIRASEIFPS